MSGYIGTQPVPQATQTRDSFTATSGQTSFATGGYTPNFLDVYLNGVKLAAADYTATNGSDVVLASGAATGDILEVVAFTTFTPADLPDGTPSIDDNGNATAITITSDENVLVGTTSFAGSFNDPAGIYLSGQYDYLQAIRSGGAAAGFSRNSSDGSIVNFGKDGTTVGSIGTTNGDTYIGTGDTTLLFKDGNDAIYPRNATGGARDGAIDWGGATNRFKDLYLSGGIYLGGTGSANKLEDYEEGTWTPSLGGNAVHNIQEGYYVKVGGIVYITMGIRASTLGTGSTVQITGLPFTAAYDAGISPSYYDGIATNIYTLNGNIGTTTITLYGRTSATNAASQTPAIFQNNARVYLSATYRTNA